MAEKTNTEFNPESLKREALQGRESQQTVMFARERSTRGHMKFPSIAQRGEGGAWGGSGEFKLLPVASQSRSVIATSTHLQNFISFGDFLLTKQKKVTCRRATPGLPPQANHLSQIKH